MKKKLIICLVFLFAGIAPMLAQKAISTQEQVIENKVRLNDLEKKVASQEQEMQNASDKKQADLESKLELKTENLEYKSNWVNYLLAILGILITFFGIGVPIAAVYYGRKFSSEIEGEKEKAKAELELFKNEFKDSLGQLIVNSKERFKLLEDKAKESIINLDNFVKHGTDAIQNIDNSVKEMEELKKNFAKKLLSEEDKNESISKAKEIGNESGKSQYEKDMAKAMELYYSDKDNDAKELFFHIIKSHPKEVTIDILSDIYFYIAYIFYLDKSYNDSIEYYEKAIALMPKNVDAWFNLGLCYSEIPDFEKALDCYKKTIELDDQHGYANLNYIEMLLFSNRFEEIDIHLEKLKRNSEIDDFDIFWLKFMYLKLTDRWDKNVNETFTEIKNLLKDDGFKFDWSFDDLNKWLSSNKSEFISNEQRNFIIELIGLIDVWIIDNKK